MQINESACGNTISCAVGIIVNPKRKILIAQRAAHQRGGGLWEFPGGKIEPHETQEQALIRELQEEIGIRAVQFEKFIKLNFSYTHSISSCFDSPVKVSSGAYILVCEQRTEPATKLQLERRRVYIHYSVLLNIFLIHHFEGNPRGMEGQPILWVDIRELDNYQFLEGNSLIINALKNKLNEPSLS